MLKILSFVLVLISTNVAYAQSIYDWGNSDSISSVSIEESDGIEAAILFDNKLSLSTNVVKFSLDFRGNFYDIMIVHGDGTEPDTIFVVPPNGYIAVPESLSVEDNSVGVIEIHQLLG